MGIKGTVKKDIIAKLYSKACLFPPIVSEIALAAEVPLKLEEIRH